MSKYDISQGTLLEGFEDSTEWTMTNGSAVNDTVFVKQGTNSLKITAADGVTCSAVKTVDLDLSRAGLIYLWVYVPTLTGISSVQIALANDSFSNYFTINASLHEGWNKINIGRTTWSTGAGSPTWQSNIVRIRIRLTSSEGNTPSIYVDSMYSQYKSRPKCIISFDDNYDEIYTYCYPIMRKYGFSGSMYVITNYLDASGRLSKSQIDDLYSNGWDVLNHTHSHTNLQSGLETQAEVESELTTCSDILSGNGWIRNSGFKHVAYPQGGYDTKTLNAMEATSMITGRTTRNRTQANEIDNVYLLTRQSHDYTSSQSTYRGYIDKAIADGGCIQLNYHQIVTDGSATVTTQVEESQFADIMQYIASKGSSIDVITWTEWYRGLTEPRKTA